MFRTRTASLAGFALALAPLHAFASQIAVVRALAEAGPEPEAQPDLMNLNLTSAVWVLAIFVILAVILYKTAWKNVLAGLKAREDRIRGDLARAEESRTQAATMLSDHEARLANADQQVRDIIAKAAADAERIAENIRSQAKIEGEAEREKARKEIESAKQDALRQVYEQTADLATTIASKIIRRNLDAHDQEDLVAQTLEQLHGMSKQA